MPSLRRNTEQLALLNSLLKVDDVSDKQHEREDKGHIRNKHFLLKNQVI